MPSPFPGMDPWLESRDIFPDLHDSMIARMRDSLNENLPPGYFATIASRIVIDDPRQSFEPDVNVIRPHEPKTNATAFNGNGGVAVATEPILMFAGDEFRQRFLEVRVAPDNNRLVTVIEVLSASNKRPGENNRRAYVRKQREVLGQKVHLVEIDLLRRGRHSTAVPVELFDNLTGKPDYHVAVSRFNKPYCFAVYPVYLADGLPNIAVPLLPDATDVIVELQPLLDRCYESGRYSSRVDYRRPPVPPLNDEGQAWAEKILHVRN